MADREFQTQGSDSAENPVVKALKVSDTTGVGFESRISAAGLLALSEVNDVLTYWKEPLARHTTFKVGGPVTCLVRPETEDSLNNVMDEIRKHGIPFIVLGGGSNVLAPDSVWDVVVVQLSVCCNRLLGLDEVGANEANKVRVYAGAGVKLARLVGFCLKNRLEGIECLTGIPGTIGGALIMNAGTSEGSIGDSLAWIDALDRDGRRIRVHRSELKIGYRSTGLPTDWIVLGGCLELLPSRDPNLKARSLEAMRRRKRTQPLSWPSAGCIFKNPIGHSAGALIDRCGLKGLRIGDAEVSEQHANWIINRGNARAGEILALIRVIEQRVHETLGIHLEREVRILGEGIL